MGLNNGTKAESWEISHRNGKPGIFTRNGKEWFDADKAWASQSGEYYILTGDRNQGERNPDKENRGTHRGRRYN